jgi:hypothetical protein
MFNYFICTYDKEEDKDTYIYSLIACCRAKYALGTTGSQSVWKIYS